MTRIHIFIHAYTHIYLPQKDEKLSWLTCSRWFTNISSHLLAVVRAQDRESLSIKDQHSITVPRNQLGKQYVDIVKQHDSSGRKQDSTKKKNKK